MNADVPSPQFDFSTTLEKLYGRSKRGLLEWQQEGDQANSLIDAVSKQIAPRYRVIRPVGVGGVGIVLLVQDTNLEVPRALKFPRPKAGREDLFAEALAAEISSLREAAHGNIIEVYQQGRISIPQGEFPFYVMEYIEGALDGYDYFRKQPRDARILLRVLDQAISGLAHLHGLKILHGDVKLDNMLVAPNDHLVITDLGSARSLNRGTEMVSLLFTRQYAHPDLIALATATTGTDPNRMRAEFPRAKLDLKFDLYALGKNIFRLLKLYSPADWQRLDPYTRRYLRLMASRLLDGQNADNECALGLPRSAFAEIKYIAIGEVATDIGKATGRFPLGAIIPEMDSHAIRTIQISSLSPTPFTDRLATLLSHPTLRRLAGVSQLGFISFVYPTANHSRLEHMLGALTNVVRYCDALYNDPINPLFRQVMNDEDLKALYLAALCHDLGQYPLAHDLEEADSEIFSHEALGTDMLKGRINSPDIADFLHTIHQQWDVTPERIAAIISANPNDLTTTIKDRILHTIIDGPIDADKVDYLVRDSENLNLPFGKAIDFQRLLQCLTIVFKDQGRRVYAALGIHEKGKVPAETVAFARYAMFGTVYWHHTSRSAKAMLHRAVWDGLPPKANVRSYRQYRESFVKFVVHRNHSPMAQVELFPSAPPELPDSTQLAPTDRDMITWVARHTSPAGQDLLQMIVARRLYKRLIVVSKRQNPMLWDLVTKFRHRFGSDKVVQLEIELQKQITDALRAIDHDPRPPTSSLAPEAIDKLIKLHQSGKALILVDIPSDRPGTTSPLEYLPEADRREMLMLEDWKEPKTLEDSVIWTHLHDSFLESAGKIRIFCYPDVRDTVDAGLSKADLERIFEAATRSLQAEGRGVSASD